MSDVTGDTTGICERLRAVREETFGPRGRAAFARALGLSPSTYIYYEKGRVPPADVLARAADVAAVRLEWLVSGDRPRRLSAREVRDAWSGRLPPALQAALDRFLETADAAAPNAAPPVRALVEILGEVAARFPDGVGAAEPAQPVEQTEGMIPILGRTAAGLVGAYEDLLGEAPAVTVADIARRALGLDVRRRRGDALAADDPVAAAAVGELAGGVSLVGLSEPLPSGVVEFIDAPAVRRRFPSAFALRVDGESMAPRILHGDVVVAVPGRAVRPGQAALVQLRGRVGITLKLVRPDGERTHLVPINDRYETETVPESDVEWTAPVLLAARFGTDG